MTRRKPLALAVAASLGAAALLLLGTGRLRAQASAAAPALPPSRRAAAPAAPPAMDAPSPGGVEDAQAHARLVAALRARYGAKLASPLGQLKLVEALVRHFRERGGDWRGALLRTLRDAFPDAAPLLAARLEQWLAYEAWMQANAGDLQRLEPEERRANLWARREALFGTADARDIWAAELRSERVASALAAIDAAPDARLPERLQRYRDSLEQAYGEAAPAFLERHRQEALDRFLDLGSVQRELSGLPPAERAAQLREIRTGLGLDAQALARWEALDGARDARWDAGARYMAEREALLREPPGPAREARLTALRERLFGAEAQTLAAEEASGFLRFEQPRRWGRN
jgi:hypothetical protein